MAQRISRRKLADYATDQLIAGIKPAVVLRALAALLIESRRVREAELLVRDIETALAERGVVVADVTSAFPLTASLKNDIAALVGAKQLTLRETVDPAVLGGLKLSLPGQQLDATLRRKINALRT